MAGTMSDYLENKVLDHVLGNTAYTAPATTYLGLWTVTLSDTSTGSTEGEVSGGSYARASVTNNTTNWPNASAGSKNNGADITFTTATGSWGTITYAAICDASTAGNILYWFDLTASKTVASGDTVKFSATTGITITQG